jgi:hypothetical protein
MEIEVIRHQNLFAAFLHRHLKKKYIHSMLETLLIKDINYIITLLKIDNNKWYVTAVSIPLTPWQLSFFLLRTNFHHQLNNCFMLLVHIKHYMFRPQWVILRCYRSFVYHYQTVMFTFTICIHAILKRSPSRLWFTKICVINQ